MPSYTLQHNSAISRIYLSHEKNISAKRSEAQAPSRLPCPDEDTQRSCDHQRASCQGPCFVECLTPADRKTSGQGDFQNNRDYRARPSSTTCSAMAVAITGRCSRYFSAGTISTALAWVLLCHAVYRSKQWFVTALRDRFVKLSVTTRFLLQVSIA